MNELDRPSRRQRIAAAEHAATGGTWTSEVAAHDYIRCYCGFSGKREHPWEPGESCPPEPARERCSLCGFRDCGCVLGRAPEGRAGPQESSP